MKKLIALTLFMFLLPACADAPNALSYFWTLDLAQIPVPGTIHRDGLFMLIHDEAELTTHFHVSALCLSKTGEVFWIEKIVQKDRPAPGVNNTNTVVFFERDDLLDVKDLAVIAFATTGYRTGLQGFTPPLPSE